MKVVMVVEMGEMGEMEQTTVPLHMSTQETTAQKNLQRKGMHITYIFLFVRFFFYLAIDTVFHPSYSKWQRKISSKSHV